MGLPGGCGEKEEKMQGKVGKTWQEKIGEELDSRVGVGMGGEQSEVLVVGTRVAKMEAEVTKGEEDEDSYMEGGGILPSVSSAGWSSKGAC